MSGRYKDVQWLDGTVGPLDLDNCEPWTALREDPLRHRLHETTDGQWVLDVSGVYIEMAIESAAKILLSWGLPLPGRLKARLIDRAGARETPVSPLPLPVAEAVGGVVVLFGPLKEVLVLGRQKPALSPIRHTIIRTLIDAGEDGLNLVELRTRSRHQGARGVLDRLTRNDDDWRSVIRFPGRGRVGGYRIACPPQWQQAAN